MSTLLETQTSPRHSRRGKPHVFKPHNELADLSTSPGARDRLTVGEVMELIPGLSGGPRSSRNGNRAASFLAARRILNWLASHPGQGWQARWLNSGADNGLEWIDGLSDPDDRRLQSTRHVELMNGLNRILLCRIVFPGYGFFRSYSAVNLYQDARATFCPELFKLVAAGADELGVKPKQRDSAVKTLTKIVLHTGRDLDELRGQDLLAFRASHRNKNATGVPLAWILLRDIADLGEHRTFHDAVRFGQLSTRELIGEFHLHSAAVREVLIRYLDERRPSMDYSSFVGVVSKLAGLFWADIEAHHPGIDTLELPEEIAAEWKHRMRTEKLHTRAGLKQRSHSDYVSILNTIRAFYRDLQEWATHDPSWAQWSFANPIRKSELVGQHSKIRAQTAAATHQRIRERLPHLPVLVEVTERYKAEQEELLALTKATPIGATFTHGGRGYRRIIPKTYAKREYRNQPPPDLLEDLGTGQILQIGNTEHDAFWTWAIIETLRHTGVRVEELLEITHLALVSYRVPKSGEIVPMLQIVPSKSNEERLLLVSPELANVFAAIITRLRNANGGTVPLTARYDSHEHTAGPLLPHLFQLRKSRGWSWSVHSTANVQKLLTQALARTGLTDATGQPLRYTPHDFRRLWATDAVGNGLPVHIAAKLMGHKSLNTTQTYVAVFDDDLIRGYRAFLAARRELRPGSEYREPTEQEWREFQQHFELRKLELGTCGRPYGTPCQHEHACIRCPSLHVDPRARNRLAEIAANLRERIAEARAHGWTGEVEGLQVSLNAAAAKLASLERMEARHPSTVTELGVPDVRS